jgi:sarcosine oxidase
MRADIIVMGLGTAGAFAAWRAAQSGASVIGLEAHDLIHPGSAFMGESRLFRAAYHEGADYVPLLLSSRDAWLQLQAEGRRRIFDDTGILSIGHPDAPQLDEVRQSLADASLEHQVLSTDDIRERFPQHGVLTDEVGVLDLLGGVLRPESAMAEVHRRAREAGAELRPHTPVHELRETSSHVEVITDAGTLTATTVIVTAGVHTPDVIPGLADRVGVPLALKPISLTWFCPEDPDEYAPARFPAFIRDGDIGSPDQKPTVLTSEQRSHISADVHRLLPGLPPVIARESLHLDLYAPDKRALLGRLSDRVIVGTAFSGHGFKLAPAFGDALVRIALGEPTDHDVSAFDPLRSTDTAGAAGEAPWQK